jgi:hypothetical protein
MMLEQLEPQAIAGSPGVCALCTLPIVSGELVRRDHDHNWVHVRCEQRLDARVPYVARYDGGFC